MVFPIPRRRRILIAEDEPRISSFLERGLQRNGYDTTVASRGDCALKLALSGDFDLLLLDIGLPFKDGWEILESLKGRNSSLRVIIVTAQESAGDRLEQAESSIKSMIIDCITKPFRFNTLLNQINAQFS
ncbi:MAG: response regulator [Synechococcales bacterium]|nr:response regulator [Synechococcales bacterium]